MSGTASKPCLRMVQVWLPAELVRQVDHWRIDHGLPRAAAVAVILEAGLAWIAAERGGGGE